MILDYHMHLRDPDERIVHTRRSRGALRRDRVGARCRRDRLHRARLLLPTDPSGMDAPAPDRAVRLRPGRVRRRGAGGEAPRPARKLGLEVDYVGERQDELAPLLEALPVGLPARLRALDRWSGSRPATGDLGSRSGRRGLAPLLRRPGRARLLGHVDVLAHPDLAKIFGRPAAIGSSTTAPRRRRPRDLDRRAAQAGRGAVPGGGDARRRAADHSCLGCARAGRRRP